MVFSKECFIFLLVHLFLFIFVFVFKGIKMIILCLPMCNCLELQVKNNET